jgi:hypothetical protein
VLLGSDESFVSLFDARSTEASFVKPAVRDLSVIARDIGGVGDVAGSAFNDRGESRQATDEPWNCHFLALAANCH